MSNPIPLEEGSVISIDGINFLIEEIICPDHPKNTNGSDDIQLQIKANTIQDITIAHMKFGKSNSMELFFPLTGKEFLINNTWIASTHGDDWGYNFEGWMETYKCSAILLLIVQQKISPKEKT